MDKSDCFSNEKELNLYLDNELPGSRKVSLDQHLATCVDCSCQFSFWSTLKNVVQVSCYQVRAPEGLKNRIHDRLSDESAAGIFGFWDRLKMLLAGRPLAPVAAAALLIVVLTFALYFRSPTVPLMPLISDMVGEHIEYVSGKLDEYGIRSTDAREIERWLASNGGLMVKFPDSESLPALSGACILNEDGNTITSVFFDDGEKRVSLFMTSDVPQKPDGRNIMIVKNVPVHYGRHTGENYAAWNSQGLLWIMVGSLPRESLMRLAGIFIPD